MGLVSFFSPAKIRRDVDACIDCAKCARACPAGLAVDKLVQIRSVECTACLECVAACPAENALQLSLAPRRATLSADRLRRRALKPVAVVFVLAYILIGTVLLARTTSHWQTNLPRTVYFELVPHANAVTHPGM